MSKIDKIWSDLKEFSSDTQVLSYWEKRKSRILENINSANSDLGSVTAIIYQLAKSLNNKEKYSAVYYLYKSGYQPIQDKFAQSEQLNEVKYELGRGLHHNRKYDHSNRLFNELASKDFDIARIEQWWDQTAYANIREKIWFKTDILPAIGAILLTLSYIFISMNIEDFFVSTIIYILLFELYQYWRYQYKVSNYLKQFEGLPETLEIKNKIKKKILIEFLISLLFYVIYYLKEDWLVPLILVVAVYFQIFHDLLFYYHLPKLIGKLNQKHAIKKKNKYN
jgi:hypothetical protein